MSKSSLQRRNDAKAEAWRERVEHSERSDDKAGDEHRRAAAHAHVMTHHALEMDDPDAHEAAASAHDKVAEMHRESAKECSEPDADDAPAKKGKK